MKKENTEFVSIHCMTYNHAKYIRKCLEGFIRQKTNFPFVAYVGDDCSSDETVEIIKEYEKKYPNIIKGIYHNKNTKAEGNFFDILNLCKGKYLIFCEGDDYWTDENKLQKQVDFMEKNPQYSLCFHPVQTIYDDNSQTGELFPTEDMIKSGFSFENLLKYNFIQTNSALYRKDLIKDLCRIFPKNMMPGDWYLHLLFAKQGKIKYLDEPMSVYRIHSAGAWGNLSLEAKLCKYCFKFLNFYVNVYKNIADDKKSYKKILLSKYRQLFATILEHKRYFDAVLLSVLYPLLFANTIARIIRFNYLTS